MAEEKSRLDLLEELSDLEEASEQAVDRFIASQEGSDRGYCYAAFSEDPREWRFIVHHATFCPNSGTDTVDEHCVPHPDDASIGE